MSVDHHKHGDLAKVSAAMDWVMLPAGVFLEVLGQEPHADDEQAKPAYDA